MNRHLAFRISAGIFLKFLILGCVLAVTAVRAEDISIPGSGNCEFVLAQLAKAFNASQNRHRVSVPPSTGTAGALRDLNDDKATIGRVGRPLREAETAKGLTYFSMGRDPVVFAGGKGVSAKTITDAQLLDVYAGKIRDWRELGGSAGPIRAIGREETDTSRQSISRVIKSFGTMKYHEGVKVVNLDPQMIELFDRYPTSFGFLNRSALYAAKSKLTLLALGGVEPTADNVESGRYPIVLEFGLAYKAITLTDAGRQFMAYIGSPAGARILREYGVLPAAPR
jgi:phosphate transport system substrate-binding protein